MDQPSPVPPPPPPPERSLFDMEIDAVGQDHLSSVSRWGKFFSITSLIAVLLIGLLMAAYYRQILDWLADLLAIENQAAGIIVISVLVIMGLILVTLFFLLRGCILIRRGIVTQNSDRVADGFRSLKVVFTISVVVTTLLILSTIINLFNQ